MRVPMSRAGSKRMSRRPAKPSPDMDKPLDLTAFPVTAETWFAVEHLISATIDRSVRALLYYRSFITEMSQEQEEEGQEEGHSSNKKFTLVFFFSFSFFFFSFFFFFLFLRHHHAIAHSITHP